MANANSPPRKARLKLSAQRQARLRRQKAWTPERKARQAAAIAAWKPWQSATGPRTLPGKAASRTNATKHGMRGRALLAEFRQLRDFIRLCGLIQRDIHRQLRHMRISSNELLELPPNHWPSNTIAPGAESPARISRIPSNELLGPLPNHWRIDAIAPGAQPRAHDPRARDKGGASRAFHEAPHA
jgi:hypothetical protein